MLAKSGLIFFILTFFQIDKNKYKRFLRNTKEKLPSLIPCLSSYKSKMEFRNRDINVDRRKQYEEIIRALANID